jgi:hypothetical protein
MNTALGSMFQMRRGDSNPDPIGGTVTKWR